MGKTFEEILEGITREELSEELSKEADKLSQIQPTLEEIEKFYKTYFQKIPWIEKLRSYDYSYFLRSYLIPPALLWVAENKISLLHAMVLLLAKRSLKNKKKVIIFSPKNRDFVLKVLYLALKYVWFLRKKRQFFEWLKRERIVVSWRDFANILQTTLVYWEKDKDAFETFLEVLPHLLEIYKIELKEDENAKNITVQVIKNEEGGKKKHGKKKRETPPQ